MDSSSKAGYFNYYGYWLINYPLIRLVFNGWGRIYSNLSRLFGRRNYYLNLVVPNLMAYYTPCFTDIFALMSF